MQPAVTTPLTTTPRACRSDAETPQGSLRGYFFHHFTAFIQLFHGLTQPNAKICA